MSYKIQIKYKRIDDFYYLNNKLKDHKCIYGHINTYNHVGGLNIDD